jgi:serine/threonine-protein kinase
VPTLDRALRLGTATVLPAPGEIVAQRYRILRGIGEGGMGVVFAAEQIGVNREVAIKVLRNDQVTDEDSVRRFYQEAQATSSLVHPSILRVLDFGLDLKTGAPYIAMDLIEGRSLAAIIEQGAIPERRAASLFAQVAHALVEAHSKGIIHRDLKPENVLVTPLVAGTELARVVDFGLAKMGRSRSAESRATVPGSALGTPRYMSPEQCQGLATDFSTDLYSLGCMLHEALTGTPPFRGKDILDLLEQHLRAVPPPLPTEISEPMRRLVSALVAKLPRHRPKTTAVVARMLEMIARGDAFDAEAMLSEDGANMARPAIAKSAAPPTIRLAKQAPRARHRPQVVALLILGAAAVAGVSLRYGISRVPETQVASRAVIPIPSAHRAEVSGVILKRVRSVPSGADVMREDALVGRTPLDVEVDTGSIALTIRKQGFVDRLVSVSRDDAETIVVPLDPAPLTPKKPDPPRRSEPTPRPINSRTDKEGLPIW